MAGGMVQLDTSTLGYEARPDGGPAAPGVLIIHTIQGMTDYVKEVAESFAAHGYVGLAVDLFEGQTARGPEEGGPLRQKLTDEAFKAKMEAGIRHLLSQSYCTGRIGVVGFCMGGGLSLRTACLFPREIQACSIFYGRMEDRELLQQLQCPVVGNFGAEDERITSWAEQEFKPEMERLGRRLEMKVYPGAPHGFHNPSSARAYRSDAANDAFQRTLDLFGEVLGRTQSAVV